MEDIIVKIENEEKTFVGVMDFNNIDKFLEHRTSESEIKNIPQLYKIGYVEDNVWYRFRVEDILVREDLSDFLNKNYTIKDTSNEKNNDIEYLYKNYCSLMEPVEERPKTDFVKKIKEGRVVENEERVRDQINKQIEMDDIFAMLENAEIRIGIAKDYVKRFISEKAFVDIPIKTNIDLSEVEEFIRMCHSLEASCNREEIIKVMESVDE